VRPPASKRIALGQPDWLAVGLSARIVDADGAGEGSSRVSPPITAP
jgi:hypothetical protein